MYARVVRFTDVSQETVDQVRAQIEASDGAPPGVTATSMKMLFDAGQATSLFIAFFATEEEMQEADRIFGAMDSSDTPGKRQSVDRCEVVIER